MALIFSQTAPNDLGSNTLRYDYVQGLEDYFFQWRIIRMEGAKDVIKMAVDEPLTRSGLAAGIISILIVVTALQNIHDNFLISLCLTVLLTGGWMTWWICKNRIRKTRDGHIGIIVFIHISDQRMWRTLHEDFVSPLEAALTRELSMGEVDVQVVPLHITYKSQDSGIITDLINKKNARCVVYGKVRARGDKYTIDLNCTVKHNQLEQNSQSQFQRDMSEGWISRLKLEDQQHLIEKFELSSSLITTCAKYVLALSLYASQRYQQAEILFSPLRKSLGNRNQNEFPHIQKIRKNTHRCLNHIFLYEAAHHLRQWHENKAILNIKSMDDALDKVFGAYKRDGSFLTLKSISSIILRSDFRQAKSNLNKIPEKHRGVVWHLNYGFVLACEENEIGLLHHYKQAKEIAEKQNVEVNLALISELEEFIEWYRADVQDIALLSFMLGFLNINFKGDTVKAQIDYETFQNHCDIEQFPKTTLALNRHKRDRIAETISA